MRRWSALSAVAAVVAALAVPSAVADAPAVAVSDRETGPLLVGALLSPERIAVVDVGSGRVVEREVGGGTLCGSPLVVADGRVVFPGTGADHGRAMSLPLSLRGRARRVGRAHVFVASARPGRVWLATLPAARDAGRLAAVREVTVAGRETLVARGRPPSMGLLGVRADGLVFDRRGRVVVWDPRSGRTVSSAASGRVARPERLARLDGPARRALAAAGARLGVYQAFDRAGSGTVYVADRRGRLFAYVPAARRAELLPIRLGAPATQLVAVEGNGPERRP